MMTTESVTKAVSSFEFPVSSENKNGTRFPGPGETSELRRVLRAELVARRFGRLRGRCCRSRRVNRLGARHHAGHGGHALHAALFGVAQINAEPLQRAPGHLVERDARLLIC